jgi:hypothetical protein
MRNKNLVEDETYDPKDPLDGAQPILIVGASPEGKQTVMLDAKVFEHPGVWGIVLSDLVGHIANAYTQQGMDPIAVRNEVLRMFEAEQSSPTDRPRAVRARET